MLNLVLARVLVILVLFFALFEAGQFASWLMNQASDFSFLAGLVVIVVSIFGVSATIVWLLGGNNEKDRDCGCSHH